MWFIPTFDIKRLQPVIFSTDDGKEDVSKNALLSDICRGTSAAPTYLPAHYFETKDAEGKIRTFDLINGGVAANNPATSLTGVESSVDTATKDNLQKLVGLLQKRVARINIETGMYDKVEDEGTNAEALTNFAKMLSDEKKSHKSN